MYPAGRHILMDRQYLKTPLRLLLQQGYLVNG